MVYIDEVKIGLIPRGPFLSIHSKHDWLKELLEGDELYVEMLDSDFKWVIVFPFWT